MSDHIMKYSYVKLPWLEKICPLVWIIFFFYHSREEIENIERCWNTIVVRQINLVGIVTNLLNYLEWSIYLRLKLEKLSRWKMFSLKMNPNHIPTLNSMNLWLLLTFFLYLPFCLIILSWTCSCNFLTLLSCSSTSFLTDQWLGIEPSRLELWDSNYISLQRDCNLFE